MPRYAPDEQIRYGKWVIPVGVSICAVKGGITPVQLTCNKTPVMQSHYLHHTNPRIFPDPYTFNPQRWLDDPDLKPKYFMGFGRGSRICLGIKSVYPTRFGSLS
jgi:hypothetical protein